MSAFNNREAVPVTIAGYTFYCESFKAAGVTVFAEQPSVTGTSLITNVQKKAVRITLTGRVYDEDDPLLFAAYIGNIGGNNSSIVFSYRGLKFTGCRVAGFSVEDTGEEFGKASVTLITPNNIQREVTVQ